VGSTRGCQFFFGHFIFETFQLLCHWTDLNVSRNFNPSQSILFGAHAIHADAYISLLTRREDSFGFCTRQLSLFFGTFGIPNATPPFNEFDLVSLWVQPEAVNSLCAFDIGNRPVPLSLDQLERLSSIQPGPVDTIWSAWHSCRRSYFGAHGIHADAHIS
jgi:hypothetical protein